MSGNPCRSRWLSCKAWQAVNTTPAAAPCPPHSLLSTAEKLGLISLLADRNFPGTL